MSEACPVDTSYYEALSNLPVAKPRNVQVKVSARKSEDPYHSDQISGNPQGIDKDTHGLKILGCEAPGISERPLSASARLGPALPRFFLKGDQNPFQGGVDAERMLTTIDEHGDITEVSKDFQKLKISRNCRQLRDDPEHVEISPEDEIAAATNGLTIQSLSSNTVVVVPETSRSSRSSRPSSVASSIGETRIYPVQRSRIRAHRRRKPGEPGSARRKPSNQSLHQSLPDEDKNFSLPDDSSPVAHSETDESSDTGADVDKDYGCAPPTAMSTNFELYELKRPDTTASEILADEVLASKEDTKVKRLLACFDIQQSEDWYCPLDEDDEESSKSKMLRLVKLFYKRITTSSIKGPLYTFKLTFGGLQNRLEDFVLLPTPPGFTLKTRVTRVKTGVAGRLCPLYYLHVEREGAGDRKCLILIAKKTPGFGRMSYVIGTDPAEVNEKSVYCVGKLRSNFIGTEFTLYSGRPICSHVPPERGALLVPSRDGRFKEELITVLYDQNVLGYKGPRKLKVVLPRMKNALERKTIAPRICEESLRNQFVNDETDDIISLRNKDPVWSQGTNAYTLNFGGRVSTASVKNFQIVCNEKENEDQILLQFGRATENSFSLDFQFPFCPLQAFAIALTSFESKIACE